MYDDALPVTGPGVMLLGGYTLGLGTMVVIALAVILMGALIYRAATRSKRYVA